MAVTVEIKTGPQRVITTCCRAAPLQARQPARALSQGIPLPSFLPPCHLQPAFYLTTGVRSGRIFKVSEPQLSTRSAKARDLARRLARREHRSIADVVERALEAYEIREAGREPASVFYARLANDYGSDLDLESVIRENRTVNPGPEL
jgi:hypothetical protein